MTKFIAIACDGKIGLVKNMKKRFNAKFNGTIRWNKLTGTYLVSCEICWDGPKGAWGQGFSTTATTERGAKLSIGAHIRQTHGVEPIIRVGLPIS